MAKGKKKPPKQEPKWRMVERVVGLLERTLDPGATVEQDVHLPDLTSKEGHTRQCDVVVTTGPEHRRTRTILEVQRRGKKVEIAHFDGWVAKMRDVGAQHLVCVSTVGYPSSVKEKAARLGPTVRLATLKELELGSSLLRGVFGKLLSREHHVAGLPHLGVLVKDPARLPTGRDPQHDPRRDPDAPAFRSARGETFSLKQLVTRLLHQNSALQTLPVGKHVIPVESDDWYDFLIAPNAGLVRVLFVAEVVIREKATAFDVREYQQDEDPLAWVLVGEIPVADGTLTTTLTFGPGPDGRLAPQLLNVAGFEDGDIFSAEVGAWDTGTVVFKQG